VRPLATLPALPALPGLFEAIGSRATVGFTYRGVRGESEDRRVDPAALRFHGGRWYMVGQDLDRGAPRTFRVDRIVGVPSQGEAGSGVLPEGFDLDESAPDDPWRLGDGEPVDVDVWVDPVEAPRVVSELGEVAVVERREDSSVVVRLPVNDIGAFRTWVLGLSHHAEVLSPVMVRTSVVDWLTSLAVDLQAGEA
jgi:predicted DNA-binding transcriptional regulator YafY